MRDMMKLLKPKSSTANLSSQYAHDITIGFNGVATIGVLKTRLEYPSLVFFMHVLIAQVSTAQVA